MLRQHYSRRLVVATQQATTTTTLALRRSSVVVTSRRWLSSSSSSSSSSPSWTFDCTGRAVLCSENHIDTLNHVLQHFLTGSERYEDRYEELVTSGEGGVLTVALALIDQSRSGTRTGSAAITREALREKLLQTKIGKDFFREQYLAAAALHWDEGNHFKAASLLETLLCRVGNDLLSSRLAQEAYIRCGQSESALGCLIRHPASFSAAEPFDATIVGLTAAGYLENGRLSEAEESAKRAVEMSGGRDLVSLLALLDTLSLSGKSSDMLETLDNYEPLHANGLGKYALLCRKGAAQVMRGNCNGGFKSLYNIFRSNTNTLSVVNELPLQLLVDSSLLLWQVIMNLDDRHVIALDEVTTALHEATRSLRADEPTKYLLEAIALSATLHSLESRNRSEYLYERKAEIQASSAIERRAKTSVWNPLSFFRSEQPPAANNETKSSSNDNSDDSNSKEQTEIVGSATKDDSDERINATKKELRALIEGLDGLFAKTVLPSTSTQKREPSTSLSSSPRQGTDDWTLLEPQFAFLYDDAVASKHARVHALKTLSKAVAHFALREYQQAIALLTPLHREGYRPTGLAAPQRDVLWQMFIEGLLRENDFDGAAMLLSERTVIVPNDGQTWKRLAMIHRANGQEKLAEEAQYTAWQLGIGQGGFGGPI